LVGGEAQVAASDELDGWLGWHDPKFSPPSLQNSKLSLQRILGVRLTILDLAASIRVMLTSKSHRRCRWPIESVPSVALGV
jgi:hypothetical protein